MSKSRPFRPPESRWTGIAGGLPGMRLRMVAGVAGLLLLSGCQIWSYTVLVEPRGPEIGARPRAVHSIRSVRIKEEWRGRGAGPKVDGKVQGKIEEAVERMAPGTLADGGEPVDILLVNYDVKDGYGLDVVVTYRERSIPVCMKQVLGRIGGKPEDEGLLACRVTNWYGPFVLDVGYLCAIALDADPLWYESVAHALVIALAMDAHDGGSGAKGPAMQEGSQ